jgi:hypothetical protein
MYIYRGYLMFIAVCSLIDNGDVTFMFLVMLHIRKEPNIVKVAYLSLFLILAC